MDAIKIENKQIMSSQRISEFSIELGTNDIGRDLFFQKWVSNNTSKSYLFYDITSFSSYSKSLEFIEWGYNRDKEKLPQLNYGMILNASTLLPLFYEIYPGSITDVTTIDNVLKRAKKYNIENITFVLDKGFYSQKYIELIIANELDFVVPMPFSGIVAKNIINDDTFKTPSNLFHFKNGRSFFHTQIDVTIGGHKLYANLYFDEKIRAREINSFAKTIGIIEDNFNNANYGKKSDFDDYFSGSYEQYKKYFETTKEGRIYKVKKIDKSINELFKRFGKIILLTRKQNSDRLKLIEVYTNKDEIEKDFDVLKNELGHKRIRSSNNISMQGRMFFNYLTLIMYNYIISEMKKNNLVEKYSITELILELKKLKSVEMGNNKSYINEITKKQKDILKSFNISLPVDA
jgi:transposase